MRSVSALLLAGATVVAHGLPPVEQSAAPARLYLTAAASSLVEQGLAAAAPTGADAASYQEIPSPGIRYLPNVARATNIPWIDSNGWRFARGMRKVSYTKVRAGSASLAAAEAFVDQPRVADTGDRAEPDHHLLVDDQHGDQQ